MQFLRVFQPIRSHAINISCCSFVKSIWLVKNYENSKLGIFRFRLWNAIYEKWKVCSLKYGIQSREMTEARLEVYLTNDFRSSDFPLLKIVSIALMIVINWGSIICTTVTPMIKTSYRTYIHCNISIVWVLLGIKNVNILPYILLNKIWMYFDAVVIFLTKFLSLFKLVLSILWVCSTHMNCETEVFTVKLLFIIVP